MEIKAARKLSFRQGTYSSEEALVGGHPRHAKKVSVTGVYLAEKWNNNKGDPFLSASGYTRTRSEHASAVWTPLSQII